MNAIDPYSWKVRIDIYEYPTHYKGLHVYLKQIPGVPRGPQTQFKDPQSRFNQHEKNEGGSRTSGRISLRLGNDGVRIEVAQGSGNLGSTSQSAHHTLGGPYEF